MAVFIGLIICFIGIGIQIEYQYRKEQAEKQKKEKIQEENKQKRKNDFERVKQFAKDNNSSIDYLLERRDQLYSNALTKWATGKLTQPVRPSTVKPVYKGNALADYTADKINKERQADYSKSLSSCNDMMNEGLKLEKEAQKKESEILEKLKSISDSEEYVAILKEYFIKDSKVFKI